MPDFLVDTNVWLRMADPAHEMFSAADSAIKTLLGNLDALYISPQVIAEYWRVLTSDGSQRGGFGWSVRQADLEVQQMEYDYPMLHDSPFVYGKWRQIILATSSTGASVYDARLAATMLAHDLTHILTFNVKDFNRYKFYGIYAIHPGDVK